MDDTPSMTFGTVIVSILQFIVIVGILSPVLLATTNTGASVVPFGYANSLNSTISNSSTFVLNPKGALQVGLINSTQNNAQALNGIAGFASTLGGSCIHTCRILNVHKLNGKDSPDNAESVF